MEDFYRLIEDKLKSNKLKLTNQRKAILEVLFENRDKFISAEDIHNLVMGKCSNTNISTVYRNIEALEAAEIIEKTILKKNMYVYRIADNLHHHCLICKECGKTESIDFCPIDEVTQQLKDKSFTLLDHKFEVYGYCKNCEELKLKLKK